eukprot:24455-Chlamydomonas_euryale.AAC.5
MSPYQQAARPYSPTGWSYFSRRCSGCAAALVPRAMPRRWIVNHPQPLTKLESDNKPVLFCSGPRSTRLATPSWGGVAGVAGMAPWSGSELQRADLRRV